MRYLLLLLAFFVPPLFGSPIDGLLAEKEAPAGVVFEIIEDDEDDLGWALPRIKELSAQLRNQFPDLAIAVVTHGREQFALLESARDEHRDIHQQTIELGEQGIDVHVCGVHASWYGNSPEEFASYVDVSASAPAQINDYEALGFELIRLEEND